MRRISLALALVGAVAATGCSGGKNSASSGSNKGVPGSTYTVQVRGDQYFDAGTATTLSIPVGGYLTSVPAGIDCGVVAGVVHRSCSADFPWSPTSAPVVTATPGAGYNYYGFAGSCSGGGSGVGTCTLTGNSDQYVLARFFVSATGHPNFSDPAIHGPEYQKWAANVPNAYHCTNCHGTTGQGQGIAPSCSLCHTAPPLPPLSGVAANSKTGLMATVNSITLTSPITVSFTLTAANGVDPVDISSASTTNLPLSNCGHGSSTPSVGCSNTTLGFALGYFSVGANSYNASGIASPYTIYTVSSGSPTMLSPTKMGNNTTKGVLTQTSPGHYTYAFPTTVVIDATKLANTHTFFMYATRQEDMSGGACTGAGPFTSCPAAADNTKGYTAVNVLWNFDATTGNAVAAKREIVNPAGCNKCHDGFQPKGLVSSAFHSGNKVDGRICNVCHNPARTSSPWANSAQYVHRIHQYAEAMTSMPYVCIDKSDPIWTPFANVASGTHAGGGTAAYVMQTLTTTGLDPAGVCTNTVNANAQIQPVAFDSTGLDLTYPQDIRNCDQCHGGALQGSQWNTNASPVACNSCHANNFGYWYSTQASIDGEMQTGGTFIPGFVAGAANEAANLQMAHPKLAVSPPDPQGCLMTNNAVNCNGNTNAAYLANAGQVPVNADVWTYDVSNVTTDVNGKVAVTFALKKNGTAVPFDACNALTPGSQTAATKDVLFNGTFGGPSIYAVWGVTQDGITTPADFNASASGYLPAICYESHTAFAGTSAATIAAAGGNYYTVTFTYTTNLNNVAGGISMLTGGVGYTYNPSSTPPLTQTSVMGPFGVQYPVTTKTLDDSVQGAVKYYGVACTVASPCTVKTGGLIVPIKDVTKVATGYTGRRQVVANALCDNCHARLGAKPTFHAGQRNDAPTCSFCHNVNQGSGGWSANASTFIHGIHGTDKRTVKFAWEGGCNIGSTFRATVQPAAGVYWQYGDCIDNSASTYDVTKVVAPRFYYPEVTYPGTLSCGECHTSNFFATTASVASKLLWTTYAKGLPGTGTTTVYPMAGNTAYPYVDPTVTTYGTAWAFSSASGTTTARGGTNLVGSPIAAACFSCHDDTATVSHMTANGGHIYEAASTAMVDLGSEGCIGCHGSGAAFDIAKLHP